MSSDTFNGDPQVIKFQNVIIFTNKIKRLSKSGHQFTIGYLHHLNVSVVLVFDKGNHFGMFSRMLFPMRSLPCIYQLTVEGRLRLFQMDSVQAPLFESPRIELRVDKIRVPRAIDNPSDEILALADRPLYQQSGQVRSGVAVVNPDTGGVNESRERPTQARENDLSRGKRKEQQQQIQV